MRVYDNRQMFYLCCTWNKKTEDDSSVSLYLSSSERGDRAPDLRVMNPTL